MSLFFHPLSLYLCVCVHKTQVSETEHYRFQEGILDTHFSIIQKEKIYVHTHTQTNKLLYRQESWTMNTVQYYFYACSSINLSSIAYSAEKQMVA